MLSVVWPAFILKTSRRDFPSCLVYRSATVCFLKLLILGLEAADVLTLCPVASRTSVRHCVSPFRGTRQFTVSGCGCPAAELSPGVQDGAAAAGAAAAGAVGTLGAEPGRGLPSHRQHQLRWWSRVAVGSSDQSLWRWLFEQSRSSDHRVSSPPVGVCYLLWHANYSWKVYVYLLGGRYNNSCNSEPDVRATADYVVSLPMCNINDHYVYLPWTYWHLWF